MKEKKLDEYFTKTVDSQNRQVRMSFGIVDDIQINKFFQLNISGFHIFDHIRKKHGNVFISSHGINNLRKKMMT